MVDTLHSFENRQKAVRRKHTRMAKGYVTKLRQDGLFVQTTDKKIGSYLLRMVMGLIMAVFAFKSFVLYWIGTVGYQGHVDALADGTVVERAGAAVMQIDPISSAIATFLTMIAS